jgi:hypothetical protein
MKALKISIVLLIISIGNSYQAQVDVRDDTFILRRDVGLDYRLYVRDNDTPSAQIKIFGINKLGGTASLYLADVIDSNYITIRSSSPDSFSGSFTYKGKNSAGAIDSATVSFTRVTLPAVVRPGDANLDNLVNHLDVLALGVQFNAIGSPRHNIDTNITFTVAKPAGDWPRITQSINAKHSDIDGNGMVTSSDFDKLKLNLGISAGTYSPKLSDTNGLNRIEFNIPDTIVMKTIDSGKIKVPIKIVHPNPQPSYGLGLTLSVENRNKTNLQDTFYNKYSYQAQDGLNLWNKSDQKMLYLEDRNSRPNHTNIVYCKTNGVNDDIGNSGGIIEIIAEEILWGITNPGDHARLRLSLKDIAFIDNSYNLLPIKPISKYVYIQKASASLAGVGEINYQVYPTYIRQNFTIEKPSISLEQFYIFNALGQLIEAGQIRDTKLTVNSSNWPKGMYFLRLENSSQTFRLIKE